MHQVSYLSQSSCQWKLTPALSTYFPVQKNAMLDYRGSRKKETNSDKHLFSVSQYISLWCLSGYDIMIYWCPSWIVLDDLSQHGARFRDGRLITSGLWLMIWRDGSNPTIISIILGNSHQCNRNLLPQRFVWPHPIPFIPMALMSDIGWHREVSSDGSVKKYGPPGNGLSSCLIKIASLG